MSIPTKFPSAIVIQHRSFRNFLALSALLVRQIGVKGIGIWKIIQFHGFKSPIEECVVYRFMASQSAQRLELSLE
jgi:hypothetical protein